LASDSEVGYNVDETGTTGETGKLVEPRGKLKARPILREMDGVGDDVQQTLNMLVTWLNVSASWQCIMCAITVGCGPEELC